MNMTGKKKIMIGAIVVLAVIAGVLLKTGFHF